MSKEKREVFSALFDLSKPSSCLVTALFVIGPFVCACVCVSSERESCGAGEPKIFRAKLRVSV